MSDSGYDSDEWEESGTSSSSSNEPKKPTDTIETIDIPNIVRPTLQKIPTTLEILNLVPNGPTLNLYRCEPAKNKYVGIHSDKLRTWPKYLLQICVFNSVANFDGSYSGVPVRLPDFKTKDIQFIRRQNDLEKTDKNGSAVDTSSVFVIDGKTDTLFFKKKCQDKVTKNDIAFYLGKKFLSYTGNIPPQFTIVCVPFINGKLCMDNAIRTPNFHVFSKRQDTSGRPNKRRKKSREIATLDTNISESEIVLRQLEMEYTQEKHQNRKFVVTFGTIKRRIPALPDGPVKMTLEYITRHTQVQMDVVDL
tara:strand:+ start:42 stop:959 length:918 start_codon:yes stop_codon:yes gene_type:complete